MVLDIITLVEASAGAVTALSGTYAAWRHVRYSIQGKKDKERQAILSKAKEEIAKVEAKLEDKIKQIEIELENHKTNISKDFGFLKETYSSEVKNLGDKIETVREQLSQQHSQLITLLTRLIDR
jgi:ferritin-like protein